MTPGGCFIAGNGIVERHGQARRDENPIDYEAPLASWITSSKEQNKVVATARSPPQRSQEFRREEYRRTEQTTLQQERKSDRSYLVRAGMLLVRYLRARAGVC